MSYNVFTIPPFDKQLKRLVKKFPSLKKEYAELIDSLEKDPMQGNAMPNSCYKIRVAIKSKGKGKEAVPVWLSMCRLLTISHTF